MLVYGAKTIACQSFATVSHCHTRTLSISIFWGNDLNASEEMLVITVALMSTSIVRLSCQQLRIKFDRVVFIVKPIDINSEPSMLDFVENYRNNHFLPEKNKDESADAFFFSTVYGGTAEKTATCTLWGSITRA